MKDPKEVWCEAYDEAIEDGHSEDCATQMADEASIDFESSLIDEAMDRLREDPELRAEVEAKVAKLDMGGRVYKQ